MLDNEKKQKNDCLFVVSYTVSGEIFTIFLVIYHGDNYLLSCDGEANISGYFCPCCIGDPARKMIAVILGGSFNQLQGDVKWCCSSAESKIVTGFLQMFNLFKNIPFVGFSVDDLPEELIKFIQPQVLSELSELGIKS